MGVRGEQKLLCLGYAAAVVVCALMGRVSAAPRLLPAEHRSDADDASDSSIEVGGFSFAPKDDDSYGYEDALTTGEQESNDEYDYYDAATTEEPLTDLGPSQPRRLMSGDGLLRNGSENLGENLSVDEAAADEDGQHDESSEITDRRIPDGCKEEADLPGSIYEECKDIEGQTYENEDVGESTEDDPYEY